jgi:hypothetical protein
MTHRESQTPSAFEKWSPRASATDDALARLDQLSPRPTVDPREEIRRRVVQRPLVLRETLRARVAALRTRFPHALTLVEHACRRTHAGYRDTASTDVEEVRLVVRLERTVPARQYALAAAFAVVVVASLVALAAVDTATAVVVRIAVLAVAAALVIGGPRLARERVELCFDEHEGVRHVECRGGEGLRELVVLTATGETRRLESPSPRELAEALPELWAVQRELARSRTT